MNAVLLGLIVATQNVQPADNVNPPTAYGSPHLARLADIFRETKAREVIVASFLNVATDAGLPSFAVESIRQTHEHMQLSEKIEMLWL